MFGDSRVVGPLPNGLNCLQSGVATDRSWDDPPGNPKCSGAQSPEISKQKT